MRALLAASLVLGLAPAAAQEITVAEGFERRPLVLDPGGSRTGAFRITPRADHAFRGFTLLDVERLDRPGPLDDVASDPDRWLFDRLAAEAGEIAAQSFFLLDPDSPASGNAAWTHPVAQTLRLIGSAPESFCVGPSTAYNLPGTVRELDCAFGFGTFTAHLLLRLGGVGTEWFAVRARALDSDRFHELVSMADTLRFTEDPR